MTDCSLLQGADESLHFWIIFKMVLSSHSIEEQGSLAQNELEQVL